MAHLTKKQERQLYQTLVINYVLNRNFTMDPYEIASNIEIEDNEITSELMHQIESFIQLYESRMIQSADEVKEQCLTIGAGPVFVEAATAIKGLDPI